jgi:ribonuclease BN (tRNA processing enzyme)
MDLAPATDCRVSNPRRAEGRDNRLPSARVLSRVNREHRTSRNRATGCRIEYGGKVDAFVTDTGYVPGQLMQRVLSLSAGADVKIYNATFTEQELPSHVGWGHSKWEEGVKLAKLASVNAFVVFHHAPEYDDAFMDGVAAEAHEAFPGCPRCQGRDDAAAIV